MRTGSSFRSLWLSCFPLAELRGVQLLAEHGPDRGVALEVGLLVAPPCLQIAVEGDRGVEVVHEVVVLGEHQRGEEPFHPDADAGRAVAVLALGVLEAVVGQPVKPPGQHEHREALGDQIDHRQQPEAARVTIVVTITAIGQRQQSRGLGHLGPRPALEVSGVERE